MALKIGSAQYSDMTNSIDDYEVEYKVTDGVTDQDETEYMNSNWSKQWGYFNTIPDLKSAIIMKAIWNVGKGYETDPETKVILEHISGWGKDTFEDILFNMEITKRIGGDAFAEIIRDEDTGLLINLKVLDPSSIKIIVDRKGIITRYEQVSKLPKKGEYKHEFKPEDMLHLSNNRIADQIHGISDIDSVEEIIKADKENFLDIKKIMHHQARPFILWKLKTDDKTKIAELVSKIDAARNLGEDMFIPDDDDAIQYEVVQVNVNQMIATWRDNLRNGFYRAIGMPLIVFGNAGTTESGGKIEYLAHEQVFEKEQKSIEQQIWNQLNIKIDLIPPTTLLENLQNDEAKDNQNALNLAPADVTAAKSGA